MRLTTMLYNSTRFQDRQVISKSNRCAVGIFVSKPHNYYHHHQHYCLLQQLQLTIAATVISAATSLIAPESCVAGNVRVQDVESPTLRAGLEAANEGRLEAAERFFKTYIAQEDPQSASAYSNLGNVHLQQKMPKVALTDFNKSIELAPDAAVPRLNRSIVYEQLGVDEQAKGNVASANEFFKKALQDCDAAIASDPKEFAAWFDKGNVQMRISDFDGALASYETAADLAPGLAGYRLRAATLQFQTGNVSKSIQTVRGIVRKYGNYAEARAVLAALYWSQGNQTAAEGELAVALDLDDSIWSDKAAVRENTRWPPALYDAYSKLLSME